MGIVRSETDCWLKLKFTPRSQLIEDCSSNGLDFSATSDSLWWTPKAQFRTLWLHVMLSRECQYLCMLNIFQYFSDLSPSGMKYCSARISSILRYNEKKSLCSLICSNKKLENTIWWWVNLLVKPCKHFTQTKCTIRNYLFPIKDSYKK